MNAQRAQFGQTNYSALKSGHAWLQNNVTYESAKHGITLNTISPRYIVPKSFIKSYLEQIP